MNTLNKYSGVGVNLRLEIIDDILREKPKFDYLEIIAENWLSPGPHHQKLEKLRADYQISFHCVGMNLCGKDELNKEHIHKIKNLANIYRPIHISDHLCVTAHGGIQHHDLLPFPYTQEYLENTIHRVDMIQEELNQQILVENLSYYIQFQSSAMSEFDFLENLSLRTDCYFLLDLNNIWVNTKNLKIDMQKELKKVNWQRVKEIHLAGPEIQQGVYVDTHGSFVHQEVLQTLVSNREKLNHVPIIYERDNNLLSLNQILEEVEVIKKALNE